MPTVRAMTRPTDRTLTAGAPAMSRLARLLEMITSLGAASTPDEVASAVVALGCQILDAAAGALYASNGQAGPEHRFRRVARSGLAAGDLCEPVEAPSGSDIARAAREKAPLWNPEAGRASCVVPLLAHGQLAGVLVLGFASKRAFDEPDKDFLLAFGQATAHALIRAELFAAERRSLERFAFLARARDVFASSIDYESTLANVVDLATPRLADFCFFDVNEGLPQARRISSPRAPAEADARSKMVVAVGKSEAPLGTLTLCFGESGRVHTPDDRLLADELATRVAAAIEHAHLFRNVCSEEQRLQLALRACELGAWEWNILTGRIVWSPILEAMHGLPKGSFGGTFDDYARDLHPDDRERVLASIDEVLAQKQPQKLSYRIVRADGAVRWLEATRSVIVDAQGAPLRMIGVCADITDRRSAEQERQENERRFRAVFDHALDAMVIADDAGVIVDANPAACELFGSSKDALLQRRCASLISGKAETPSSERLKSFLAETMPTSTAVIERGDGSLRLVEYNAVANIVLGRHFSVLRDVTDRKRAEDALMFLGEVSAVLGSSLDYGTTLASVAKLAIPQLGDWATIEMREGDDVRKLLAVAHVDASKVDLVWELHRRLANGLDDLPGLAKVSKVLRTGSSELVSEISETGMAAAVADPDLLALIRSIGVASSMCVPLRVRGKIAGAISVYAAQPGRRFVPSDLRVAEEVAQRANVALENARSFNEAQDANRIKDEFLATVSHELRTPLSAILGWASMLQTNEPDPEALRRGLETIERNARAQARLIEDVLDVSRIIAGNLRLDIQAVDMSAVVHLALEVVEPMARAKGVVIESIVDEAVGSVAGDPDRLQQVIWNVVSNAVKFTPQGGRVILAAKRDNAQVVVRVTDTGEGISASLLPFIFDRFRQADSSSTRQHGGLGLGLAIARHLTELHGGAIRAESAGKGFGAVFTISLPIRAVQVAQPPESRRSNESTHPPGPRTTEIHLGGLRVLVCDDEPDARELVTTLLTAHGAEVRAVASVLEAMSAFAEFSPDVIVSDIGMPQLDGYSLIRKIRRLAPEQGGRTPALALTAYARREDANRAFAAGYQLHVAKPVDPARLVASVGNLGGRFLEDSQG